MKSLKLLLRGNTGPKGTTIYTDKTAKASLQHRNTPIRGINKSPAHFPENDIKSITTGPIISEKEKSLLIILIPKIKLNDKHSKALPDLMFYVIMQETTNGTGKEPS